MRIHMWLVRDHMWPVVTHMFGTWLHTRAVDTYVDGMCVDICVMYVGLWYMGYTLAIREYVRGMCVCTRGMRLWVCRVSLEIYDRYVCIVAMCVCGCGVCVYVRSTCVNACAACVRICAM